MMDRGQSGERVRICLWRCEGVIARSSQTIHVYVTPSHDGVWCFLTGCRHQDGMTIKWIPVFAGMTAAYHEEQLMQRSFAQSGAGAA